MCRAAETSAVRSLRARHRCCETPSFARHELTVIVSSFGQANDVRVAPAVLVCAHVAHSLVSTLRAAVASLRDNGAQIIGIVLWAADAPSLDPPWIFESWFANDRAATDASLMASDR